MNYCEMSTCDRIKFVQSQLRTAVQNHQVLYVRMLCCSKDPEIENMMRIMQELIMSLGRRQTELMCQFKQELRDKYPDKETDHRALMAKYLGWHDRHEPCNNAPVVKEANGSASDFEKRAQIVKKKPAILARSGQKMTSLLKVNNVNNSSQPRKESERLKAAAAAAAKQPESLTSVLHSSKKLHAPMKLKNEKLGGKQDPQSRRSSVSDDKPGLSDVEFSDPKLDTALAGYKLSPQDRAISVEDLSQEQYLECFGLVHKEKSKSIVVSQTKRKRRSAAGQSNFYNDYFQPRRPYNRKVLMSTPTDSATSSQELAVIDSDKPSTPTSPEDSSCAEPLEGNTPTAASPVDSLKSSKEVENYVESVETKEGNVEDEEAREEDAEEDGKIGEKFDGSEKNPEEKAGEDIEKTNNEDDRDGNSSCPPLDMLDGSYDSVSVSKLGEVENDDTQTEMEGIEEELPQENSKIDEDDESKLDAFSDTDSDSSSLSPKESELDDGWDNSFSIIDQGVDPSEQPQVPPKRDSTCGVCEEQIEPQAEKCGACGAPSSCSASPSDISSIVGVDLGPSTLSSSDCSEMIKRYLDGSQATTSLDSLNRFQEHRISQILLSYLPTERNLKVLDKSNAVRTQELDNTTKADETSKIGEVGNEETSLSGIESADPIVPASDSQG